MRSTTSQRDTCRRYLCADLHEAPSRHHAAYGGHFGRYLNEQFDIERLPYSITIVEMLERGMIKPDLLIKFPKNANEKRFSDFYKKGILFSSLFHSNEGWDHESFLHPYDVLNSEAWRCKTVPSVFKPEECSDGFKRIPYEAYFRFWKIYIFAEALSDGYDRIDRFRPYADEGIGQLEERFQKTNDHWEKTYKDAFDRLSYYQAAKAILHTHKTLKRSVSEQEWAKYLSALEFIQQKLIYTPEMMEDDIATLLDLFHAWERQSKKEPKYYTQGLVLLRQDIYDLTKWLKTATRTTWDECFEIRNGWRHYSGANYLKHVVCFERFDLERVFARYTVELCCKEAETILKTDQKQAKVLFDRLSGLSDYNSSFGSWVRILYDLQGQLGGTSTKNPISFKETRIVDYLRNFAITTEALIRQIIVDIEHQTNRLSLLKVFKGLQNKYGKCKNPTYRDVLGTVIKELSKDKRVNITDLHDIDDLTEKNESIFSKVNSTYQIVPGSNDVQKQFAVHSILSFVTARNYAAHHFCRDDELNNPRDDQSCQIFYSCIASIVFIDTIVQEIKKAPIVQYTAINP